MPEKADPSVQDSVAALESKETRVAIQRAHREYRKGLELVADFGKKVLRGGAIFHAAYAAEKISLESTRRVITQLCRAFRLEPRDIPHAAESDKRYGIKATKIALELGFRRSDIPYAAGSFSFWPNLKEGIEKIKEMIKMFKRVRVDVHEADIRYSALTLRNLDMDSLERALRDRHHKNEREPWLRGASIPIVAYCYRLSAPHTGPAIDECREKGVRRDRIGHNVLAILGRRFGKALPVPAWL